MGPFRDVERYVGRRALHRLSIATRIPNRTTGVAASGRCAGATGVGSRSTGHAISARAAIVTCAGSAVVGYAGAMLGLVLAVVSATMTTMSERWQIRRSSTSRS